MALGQNVMAVPRLRLEGVWLLFMGNMEAIRVWGVLLKHNPATLNEAVPLKRAVGTGLGVFQVSASANHWFAMGILTVRKIVLMKTGVRMQKADLPVTLINLLPT